VHERGKGQPLNGMGVGRRQQRRHVKGHCRGDDTGIKADDAGTLDG
jgi:hypothetical protein